MKKLMFMAAAACAAASVQAASVTWTVTKVMGGEADGNLVYAFISSINAPDSTFYPTLVIAPDDALSLIRAKDAPGLTKVQVNYDPIRVSEGTVSYTEDLTWDHVGQGDSVTGYLIILNSDSLATATGYILTDPLAVTFAHDNSAPSIAVGSLADTSFTSLADIPEPTSAMLVLLGAAGLALKRKRAALRQPAGRFAFTRHPDNML